MSYVYLSIFGDADCFEPEGDFLLKDQVCVALLGTGVGELQSVMLDMPSSACRHIDFLY